MTKKTLKRGVICILDALGTKGLWTRNNPRSVIQTWEDLIDSFLYFKRAMIKDEWVKFSSPPNVKAFSDTVIISYDGKNMSELLGAMSVHLMFPFCQALVEGIYLRGAITIGEYYESKSILIGPAIDAAANWYTKTDWIGVSLTPSASYLLDKKWKEDKSDKDDFLIKYEAPLKNKAPLRTWVLNWPAWINEISSKRKNDSAKSILLDSFSKSTIFDDSYIKFENTIKFLDYVNI